MTPARRQDVRDGLVGEFWDYWFGLSRPALVPSIADYLDRAPAHLQPAVAIVDAYGPAEFKVRLFGTALVDLLGRELTGGGPLDMYAEQQRATAAHLAWTSVNRPCGYLCKRRYRDRDGRIVDAHGISLPVDGGRAHRTTMLNFTSLPGVPAGGKPGSQLDKIQALEFAGWIDIGAGVPE